MEVEAVFLKMENEVRAWQTPAGDSSWPVPALPREESPPLGLTCGQPVVRSGLPDAPCADSCPSAGPGQSEGADPTPRLTLSGLA